MFVKICGITRAEDAAAAAAAGARAIGFVFWPHSPRFIDPFRARAIARALPPFVSTVGVFVNQPVEYVNGVVSLARLSAVQLHGDEDIAYVRRMRAPVVKSVSVDTDAAMGAAERWPSGVLLLIDVQDHAHRGGTGRTVDWGRAAALAARRQVLLSGGLRAENVRDAVAAVRPYGIDVSSGVERAPGIKDPARLTALFEALHGIDPATARS